MGSSIVRLLVPLTVLGAALPAVAEGGPAGYWKGGIATPTANLAVIVDVAGSTAAGWSAKISIPAQGMLGVDMTGVEIDGRSVAFRIPGVPGDPIFRGTLSEDGGTISGDFSQAGQTMPFNLSRAERPEDADADPYAEFERAGVPGQGLAGAWRGMLEVGPGKLRLRLEVSDGAAGPSAVLVSVDQGDAEMPVSAIERTESTVAFEMPTIGARFRGEMSADGSELTGQWSQGGRSLPLTFRRGAS